MKHHRYLLFRSLAIIAIGLFILSEPSKASDNGQTNNRASTHKAQKSQASLNASVSTIEMNAADTVLAKHNIILFIDQSGSMAKADCPGKLSRWDWCAQQSGDLARRLSTLSQDNLTIIPFATEYSVHPNCNAEMVEKIFQRQQPAGNTNLLDRYDYN